jgi:hypothetical protein
MIREAIYYIIPQLWEVLLSHFPPENWAFWFPCMYTSQPDFNSFFIFAELFEFERTNQKSLRQRLCRISDFVCQSWLLNGRFLRVCLLIDWSLEKQRSLRWHWQWIRGSYSANNDCYNVHNTFYVKHIDLQVIMSDSTLSCRKCPGKQAYTVITGMEHWEGWGLWCTPPPPPRLLIYFSDISDKQMPTPGVVFKFTNRIRKNTIKIMWNDKPFYVQTPT